jgi:DNA-binding response OmpR family regulator
MSIKYLAIEKDEKFHEQESTFWLSRGVDSIRVSSMTEGIKEAMKQPFLYIGINAANINYKPQLPLLREATNDPIFISTTTYTMQEQGEAISLGADLFGQIGENPNDNFATVMANIEGLRERSKRRKSSVKLISYGDILVAPKHRQVFLMDKEVVLTKTDFDLLCFFINNRGLALTPEQLYNCVWKNERADTIEAVVKSAIGRLRKKIDGNENEISFIENVWGVGYRLPSHFEK